MRLHLMRLAASAFVVCALVAPGARADEQPLTIGDPAPPIAVSEWVKGGPVESFQDDKVYVVEFWATWCGPCRTSIPHLTELQEKYKDQGVEILGISVFESNPEAVGPFVEEMGAKMDYHVAKDLIPEGGERDEGKMAQAWMEAAQEGGIPTAFVIKGGQVAWIGHPMTMDEPLGKIVAGDYDIAAARAAREEEKAAELKLMAMQRELAEALQADDHDRALEIMDRAIAETPALEQALAFRKLLVLRDAGRMDQLEAHGNKLLEGPYGENPQALNQIAWFLADPARTDDVPEAVAQLALKAGEKAAELTDHEDWMILDTLARAQFVAGQLEEALATQKKAVELAGDDADDEVKGRLEQYQKALDDKS